MQYDDVTVGIEQAYLSFDRGDLQTAQGWLKERGLPIDMVPDFTADTATLGFYLIFLRGLEYVLLARILLFQEKPDEALQVIRPACTLIEKHECWLLGYQLKLLEILALQAKAESQFVCEKVADLLVLTMPEGFIRLYLDLGTPVQELLKTVRLKYHLDRARGCFPLGAAARAGPSPGGQLGVGGRDGPDERAAAGAGRRSGPCRGRRSPGRGRGACRELSGRAPIGSTRGRHGRPCRPFVLSRVRSAGGPGPTTHGVRGRD